MAKRKLENRILVLAVIILLVAFAGLTIGNVFLVSEALEASSMHESRAVAESAAGGIRTLMRSATKKEKIEALLPRYVDEVLETGAVEDIHLFNLAMTEPFRESGKLKDEDVLAKVGKVFETGRDRTLDVVDTTYYVKPIAKEETCDACHYDDPDGTRVRGVVVVAISKVEAAASVRRSAIVLAGSALFTIILVFIGVKLVTRKVVTAPLAYLTQVSDDISKGKLDEEVKLASEDEVGALAEAIERLRLSMKLAMDRLRKR